MPQTAKRFDKSLPEYKTISIKGPAHAPIFEIELSWHNKILAVCEGKSKKEAQQECAYTACKKFN